MQDKIEEFIKEHRHEFDTFEPGAHVWQGISNNLQQKKRIAGRKYMALAASVLIIVGAFLWFFDIGEKKPTHNEAMLVITPEMMQVEGYYALQVKNAVYELNKYSNEYPELCKGFNKEIESLNAAYNQLKEDYKGAYGNEAVIKAMIENLQLQMKILNLQLQILQNIKQKETQKHYT